jgi:hypothetical protein
LSKHQHLGRAVLEGLKLVIVQAELYFEGSIRHTPLALEQFQHLGKDGIKIHHRPFSMARAWGTIYDGLKPSLSWHPVVGESSLPQSNVRD